MSVSRETIERLAAYEALLLRWTKRINLISRNTVEAAWQRHIVDSAQIFPLADENWRIWVDLGSGGGLPGLVVAILAKELIPEGQVHLVESDLRKSVFLETVKRELDLNVTVHQTRIEDVQPFEADIVSARALASVSRLLPLSQPFCGTDTRVLLMKGAGLDSELTEAEQHWHIEADQIPSVTDPSARILQIRQFRERA
ncbi:16S rRNA (guanine(527)-N(7))-methyltransferase RsmG [Rhodobacteraceae bacterium NNCM2]|nr:16S rRNA (guanine(527)-N(7))-methyltransferase RsmG [Coraliihabitans acroporae]